MAENPSRAGKTDADVMDGFKKMSSHAFDRRVTKEFIKVALEKAKEDKSELPRLMSKARDTQGLNHLGMFPFLLYAFNDVVHIEKLLTGEDKNVAATVEDCLCDNCYGNVVVVFRGVGRGKLLVFYTIPVTENESAWSLGGWFVEDKDKKTIVRVLPFESFRKLLFSMRIG